MENKKEIKNEAVETKQASKENESTKKLIASIDVEELVTKDEKLIEVTKKPFRDLTEEDAKIHMMCPAKVFEDERTTGYGNTQRVVKFWRVEILLCKTVILGRNLTDDEVSIIKMLNPKLIGKKSITSVPVKLMTGIDSKDNRYFRYVACLADNVYFGSSRNNSHNNGFLTRTQVTNCVINNRLCKSHLELKPVLFAEVNNDAVEDLEKEVVDLYAEINSDF